MQFSGFERAHLSLAGRQPSISEAFPGSTSHSSGRSPAAPGSSQLLLSPSQGEEQEPGVRPFLRQRAGLSLCLRPSRSSPAAPCPPWTASLRLSGSTKGTLHAGAAHWQRTHGCVRGQEYTHTISTEKVGAFSPLTFVNFL